MNNILTQHIYKNRNGKRTKVGMFLGLVIDNEIRVGYSLCSKEDTFDAEYALALAGIRALSDEPDECPPSIGREAGEFADRCLRYFKGSTLWMGPHNNFDYLDLDELLELTYEDEPEIRTYPLPDSVIVEVF